ncbi:PD-(D/E)XK nuclease-like domain-containing protein [Bernardetia sp. Wsw4-3y2]|uniref:PD-(D/E)XK nuclease-like domain-containing protein n=1 Tax=Bernardetia sp. Wsw4-3y2 TaxID=3127471 RepID=UPI0030D4ED8E
MTSTPLTQVASPQEAAYLKHQIGEKNGKPVFRLEKNYDAVPAIRNSALSYLAKSPMHYKAFVDGEYKLDTKPLYIGQLLHLAVLEPHKAHWEMKIPRKGKGIDARIREQEEEAQKNGIYLFNEAEMRMIDGILNTVYKTPELIKIIKECQVEKSLYWKYRGLQCKGKLDLLKKHDYIADLKFVIDARPSEFIRKAGRNYDYDRQMAFYRLGARMCGLAKGHIDCFFIAIEKSAPYPISIIEVTESTLKRGEEKYEKLFDTYFETIAKGEYPAYPLFTKWETHQAEQVPLIENTKTFSFENFLQLAQ